MKLSQAEAKAALQEIDNAGVKSHRLYGYRAASALLLLWGGLWIVVGLAAYFSPENVGLASLITTVIGIPPSLWISYRGRPKRTAQETASRWTARGIAGAALVTAFILLSQALLQPSSAEQASAYVAFVGGAICTGVGIFGAGMRYIVIGCALCVAALSIYWFNLPHQLALIWFAAGAAMMAGALWMRKD